MSWIEAPTLEVDLASPASEAAQAISDEDRGTARTLLDAILGAAGDLSEVASGAIASRTDGRWEGEFRWWAEVLGVPWHDLVLANCSYELVVGLGCSTVALPTPGGPVLARNMDWMPEALLALSTRRIRLSRGARWLVTLAGWPGSVGVVSGLSPRGFAIVLNAVGSSEPMSTRGQPVLLTIRRVLQDASGFEQARQWLLETPLVCPGLFTLVGSTNAERVVIERTPSRAAQRWGKPDEPLVATNHYLVLEQESSLGGAAATAELTATACSRFSALKRELADHSSMQAISDDRLLYALTDPDVMQDITAQHVILRPTQQVCRVLVPSKFVGTLT